MRGLDAIQEDLDVAREEARKLRLQRKRAVSMAEWDAVTAALTGPGGPFSRVLQLEKEKREAIEAGAAVGDKIQHQRNVKSGLRL